MHVFESKPRKGAVAFRAANRRGLLVLALRLFSPLCSKLLDQLLFFLAEVFFLERLLPFIPNLRHFVLNRPGPGYLAFHPKSVPMGAGAHCSIHSRSRSLTS